MLLIRQSLSFKHMVHTLLANLTCLNIRTTSSKHLISLKVGKLRQHMLQKVQSRLTQHHGVSIFQKTCIPKFIGMQCD
jgi:hypothetical protein